MSEFHHFLHLRLRLMPSSIHLVFLEMNLLLLPLFLLSNDFRGPLSETTLSILACNCWLSGPSICKEGKSRTSCLNLSRCTCDFLYTLRTSYRTEVHHIVLSSDFLDIFCIFLDKSLGQYVYC